MSNYDFKNQNKCNIKVTKDFSCYHGTSGPINYTIGEHSVDAPIAKWLVQHSENVTFSTDDETDKPKKRKYNKREK